MKTVFCVGNKVILVEVCYEVCKFCVGEGFEGMCCASGDNESGIVRICVHSRGGNGLGDVVDV